MVTLTPTTTGRVYKSTLRDFESGILPSLELSQDHPFQLLWQNHRIALTTTGNCDTLIDAFIAIRRGDPLWRRRSSSDDIVTHRQSMRSLLLNNPPDIVLIEQTFTKGHGFHDREAGKWPFVCITLNIMWTDGFAP